jgi:hypothetical protein
VRVWLDDLREAPPGWVRVRTPEEAIALLETGEVTEMSLDHDLGLLDGERERTGYDVLLWLEREVAEGRWVSPLPEIRVHSANPVGRARMERAIASIRRLLGDTSE